MTSGIGGPLTGIKIRVRVIRGKSHDVAQDEVLHEEVFENLRENQVNLLKRLNGLRERYMAPLLFQAEVIRGDPANIGDLVVTFRFRRRQQAVPIGQRK